MRAAGDQDRDEVRVGVRSGQVGPAIAVQIGNCDGDRKRISCEATRSTERTGTGPEHHRNKIGTAPSGGREVGFAVIVEVPDRDRTWLGARGIEVCRYAEGSIAGPTQDRDVVRTVIRRDEVELAIVVEVPDSDRGRRAPVATEKLFAM